MIIIELAVKANMVYGDKKNGTLMPNIRFKHLADFAAFVRAEREWVDLTCEEVTALIREGAADGGWQGFATRVQDAFKEKNK